MGLLYGVYAGRSDGFQPGGASYETGFCPHGGKLKCSHLLYQNSSVPLVSYDEFKKASEMELEPRRISEGTIGKIFLEYPVVSG
jgi:homogentisate 1,2-dioxygenase